MVNCLDFLTIDLVIIRKLYNTKSSKTTRRSNFTEQAINNSILLTVINLLYSLISLRFGILRLHDVNLSGWYLFLGFVPLISGLFSLYLLFAPGTDGENDYGHQPREGNKLGLFGLAFFVVALFWFGWG